MAEKIEYSVQMQQYMGYIAAYDKAFDKWLKRTEKIVKRYKDEGTNYQYASQAAKFNILWSNVQTLVPATFSRLPQPDVSRRFRDSDPVGRVASLILERALEFEVKHYSDYRETMRNSVFDRFLGGRGTAWVRYEPKISAQNPAGGEYSDEGEEEPLEQIDDECAPVDYVHWRDFGHSIARTWEEVTCVWRKLYLTEDQVKARFGEDMATRIPYDTIAPTDDSSRSRVSVSGVAQINKQALIYEIWNKNTKTACWISKTLGDVIEEKADPLGLESFFPCPRPLFGTITTDSLIPTPDFVQYQDQANELDTLSDRIDGLIKALKVAGVYNAQFKELQRLFTEAGNTDLIPVKDWAAFAEKGGLDAAVGLIDLQPIAQALQMAYQAREELVSQVYMITGISDIMRGESDAAETAAAQGIKARFGAIRLRTTQEDVALYATDLLRLKAEVMCNKFTDETLMSIASVSQLQETDQQLVPQALQLLRQAVTRDFRIEIAADSLVQIDEEQEKQSRLEFLSQVSAFLEKTVPAAQAVPQAAPALLEMLKFGVSAFKAGKTLEGMLDMALQSLQHDLAAQQNQPKPPPIEIQKVMAESQGRMQELQAKAQVEMQIEAAKQQFEREKAAGEQQVEILRAHLDQQTALREQQFQAMQAEQENQLEAQRSLLESHMENQREEMRAGLQAHADALKQQFDLLIARINNAAKVEVAEIQAQTTIDAAQIGAAKQSQED